MSSISAVIDTNVLVSGFGWPRSIPGRILEHALAMRFVMITSGVLLDELARVLSYPKLRRVFLDPRRPVQLVAQLGLVVEPSVRLNVVTDDEADNRVLEAAQASRADYVVTGDQHLLKLTTFGSARIVSPADFIKVLVEEKS